MAIAPTQSTSAQIAVGATSTPVSLGSRTSGYLLVSTVSLDKDAGSLPTVSTGWTLVTAGYRPASTQVTGAMAYRIADGTATDTCTWSWTTALASPGTVAIAEFNLVSAVLANGAQSTNTTSATLTTSADAGAATATGLAVAGWGQDSVQTVATVAWSNSYTHILTGTPGTNAGRAPVSMAYKVLANGTTTSTTATTTGTSDQTFVIIARFTGTEAPAYATVYRWLGAVAPTSIALTTHCAASATVIPRWSTNSGMTGATTTTSVGATSEGWAKHAITGLAANTTYYYVVSVNGVDSDVRSFKTLPTVGSAANFSFAFASCLQETSSANPQTLTRIQDRNPAFWLCPGDLNYFDTDTTTVATYRGMHQETIQRGNFEALTSRVPLAYTWSDHDTCGDSTHAGNTGITAVNTAYRDVVPSYTLPSTGIYHTFAAGRVRFIVWDGRTFRSPKGNTDNSAKTLLGATQKQWTKDTIAASTEPLIFIVSEVVWSGGGTQDDHWGSYLTEQAELVAWFNANLPATRKLVFLTGDAHMLAADDGTNGGGYPSWNAAPIAQIASEKGGPWSVGRSTEHSQMYGFVNVTDDGTNLSAKFTGYRADTEAVAVGTSTSAPLTHTVGVPSSRLGPAPVDLSTQGTIRTANSVATIVSQIDASSAGDTVEIAAGSYTYVTTTKSIPSGFIRIVPAPGATVSIAGVDMTSAQGLDWRGINTTGTSTYNNWWQDSSRCRWRGGTHTMSAAGRTAFTVRQGCSDIVIEDVTVTDAAISFIVQAFTEATRSDNIVFQRFRSNNVAQDHVLLSRGSNIVVQDFECLGHTESTEHQDGVQIVGAKTVTLRRGHLWNTRAFRNGATDQNDHGIIVNYDDAETPDGRVPENITLENLLIHDQTSHGITVAGVLGMTIRNCTVYDNGPSGAASALSVQPDTGNTISGLVIVNNMLSSWFSSGTIGYTTNTHNFVADATGPAGTSRLTGAPGFVDNTTALALDYKLTSSSQNRLSGTSTGAATDDYNGLTRPSPPSRGAIEIVSVGVEGALAGTSPMPTSGLAGVSQMSGVMSTASPLPSSSIAGVVRDAGALAAAGPLPTASVAGVSHSSGVLAAASPLPISAAAGSVQTTGVLASAGLLPAATLTAAARSGGVIAATSPLPSAAVAGSVQGSGALAGTSPFPVAALGGASQGAGSFAAAAPAPVAAMQATQRIAAELNAVAPNPTSAVPGIVTASGQMGAAAPTPTVAFAAAAPGTSSAIRFDAAGDRVYLSATLPASTSTGRTICGWFKISVDLDGYSTYWRTSAAFGTVQTVASEAGGVGINVFTASGSIAHPYVNAVDEWVYIATVENGTTTVSYVIPNGGATVSQSGTVATSGVDQFCLGGRSSIDATDWFNGCAAHVRVFAAALTQAQVEAEAASQTAVLPAWADWPLSEDLLDDSGNARHLTAVSGSPTYEAGPPLEGGDGPVVGVLGAVAPTPAGALAGAATNSGAVAAAAPRPVGVIPAAVTATAALAAAAPAATAQGTAAVTAVGAVAATLTAPTAVVTGQAATPVAFAVVALTPSGAFVATAVTRGELTTTSPLPTMTAAAAVSAAVATGQLSGQIGARPTATVAAQLRIAVVLAAALSPPLSALTSERPVGWPPDVTGPFSEPVFGVPTVHREPVVAVSRT